MKTSHRVAINRWTTLLFCGLVWLGGSALAQVPELLSYQGKLLDNMGAPVADGNFAMEFRFYDACSGGNLLLTDAQAAVATVDGIYNVLLGSGALIAGVESDLVSVFSNHDLVCVGIQIESDSEMVPRQQIVSSGYAMRSAVADAGSQFANTVEPEDSVNWTGTHVFENRVDIATGGSFFWPLTTGNPPPASGFRLTKILGNPPGQETHPNGESDEQWMICYNCVDNSTVREDLTQHGWNQKIESNYWDGIRESLEYNWNYTAPTGFKWRPFAFRLIVDGTCSHNASVCTDDAECGGGNTCDGANEAEFQFHHGPPTSGISDLEIIRQTGVVRFGRGLTGVVGYTGSVGANASLRAVDVQTTVDTTETSAGPTVFGALLDTDFASDTPDAQLPDLIGLRSAIHFSGSSSDRDITTQMIAVDAQSTITQTGTGATVNRAIGYRYKFQPTGNFVLVGESNGLRIDAPGVLAGSNPVQIDRHFGVRIYDQMGLGAIEGGAITISAQDASPSAERGNITMKGGTWNDGHLVLDDGHLWFDSAAGLFRRSAAAPTAQDDGAPLHSPAGTDSNWGGIYWGDGTDSVHDSGSEICTLAGLSCRETYDMGASSSTTCGSSAHAGRFMALCY